MAVRQKHFPGSIDKRYITGRNVHHVDVHFLQDRQDGFDQGPSDSELLLLFGFPLDPDVIRELWNQLEIGTCEIQEKGPRDDAHLDDAGPVIMAEQLRDIKSQDFGDFGRLEALVDRQFAEEGLFCSMHLNGGGDVTGLQVAFCSEDDTMNTKAQSLGELEPMSGRICLGILYQYFVHDYGGK